MWTSVEIVDSAPSADEWTELPESGFGALIAWCLPTEFVLRVPLRSPVGRVVTYRTVSRAATTRDERPRSWDDQDVIDEDIDEYLREAGLPPRPRRYRWFVRSPRELQTDELYSAINRELEVGSPPSPSASETRAALAVVLTKLYDVPVRDVGSA